MKVHWFAKSNGASLALAAALAFTGVARAQDKARDLAEPAKEADTRPKIEKATFGGGCFWCLEAVFEHVKGVTLVVSGFAGGSVPNPTYQLVCTGLTGHAEVVQVTYDASVVSFEKLLNIFMKSHDPTTPNMQGDDYGTQYRSIILYHSDAQKTAARKYYRELTARHAFRHPIVTELAPLTTFYPAEDYHQDYYLNHRGDSYSTIYIEPKLRKLRQSAPPAQRSR